MADKQEQNKQLIRDYLKAHVAGAIGEDLAKFFTSDAIQIEYPNKLNPNGGKSDRATILQRAEQGQKILTHQSFEIQSEIAEDDRIAIEAMWTGTLAIPIANLQAGDSMKAHFSMHFEIRDGRIALQKNYDCFEPF